MFWVNCQLPPVPKVPGVPLLGNLLQLKEKKPYKTFTNWAEIYGPIYSIQLGSSNAIVLSNSDVAKEAMGTRFPAISTRKLSNALKILTKDKCMVALSDFDDFHKDMKKLILAHLLSPKAQKRNHNIRETMLNNMVDSFKAHVKKRPLQPVNFRDIFESELFGFSLKQAIGRDVQSLYVEELGAILSRSEIFQILVLDMMKGAIEVDWRDFFPYLKWVPGSRVEAKVRKLDFHRIAVMQSLIRMHKKLVEEEGEETNSYIDALLSEASTLTEVQLGMLLWESIIASSDTTLVTTEWAIFELAKDLDRQLFCMRNLFDLNLNRSDYTKKFEQCVALTRSLKITCANYLIFHETMRKHTPVPILPIRYVHEDTQIGGYHVPTGSQIIINLYGCSHDRAQWENPEEWNPERFLDDKHDPHNLFNTMAFGAGKRVCSGALQAMLVSCTSIGRLVQEFQLTGLPEEEEDIDTLGLTTRKLHPLHVVINPRVQF